MIEDHC